MRRTTPLAMPTLLILLISMILGSPLAHAQPLPCEGWATIPGQTNPYHEGSAFAVTYFDFDGDGPEAEQLVIGGSDLRILGGPAGNILRWDGQRWHPVGGPVDGVVYALRVYDGALYAGGNFSRAGSQDAPVLARWGNGDWEPVASDNGSMLRRAGVGTVRALAVHAGQLVIGGAFGLDGRTGSLYLASWNGTSFGEFGLGVNGYVRALTTHRGELIVGGDFNSAGGVTVYGIARWNGSAWNTAAPSNGLPGVSGTVRALASFDGSLYIGGNFNVPIGDEVARGLVALSDFGWINPSGGLSNGEVRSLLPSDQGLLVAGTFQTVAGAPHRGLALLQTDGWNRGLGEVPLRQISDNSSGIWAMTEHEGKLAFVGDFDGVGSAGGSLVVTKEPDGWRSFAPGGLAGGPVYCMVQYRGEYYIGGAFKSANGRLLGGLAKWDGRDWVRVQGWEGSWNVVSLVVGDDKLWVHGRQTPAMATVGPDTVEAAIFDGSNWIWSSGTPDQLSLRKASFWQGKLVVPGVPNAWTWDGEVWQALPTPDPAWAPMGSFVKSFGGELYSAIGTPDGTRLTVLQDGVWAPVLAPDPDPTIDMTEHGGELAMRTMGMSLAFWNGSDFRDGRVGYVSSLTSVGSDLYAVVPDTFRRPYPNYLYRIPRTGLPVGLPNYNATGDNGRPFGDFFGHVIANHPRTTPPRPETDCNLVFISGPPAVISQPITPPTCPHTPLRLDLVVLGSSNTYQWRRDGMPIEFATESVYEDVFPGDSRPGLYDCVITNACGETISASVRYAPCAADHDCNGFIDFFDYADFVTDFETGSPRADVNRDGFLDAFDYEQFVEAFESGCE